VSVVGFAVAGGASRRMGRDKALLPWGETDLLGHALARLQAVTSEVRILCGTQARYGERGVPVDLDPVPGAGPIAGLLAALEAARGRPALLLAADLPLVPEGLLSCLAALAPDADAVVPLSLRGPEPLCALYGAACLDPVRRRVARGELRMTSFWPDVRVRELAAAELAAFGEPDRLFLNLNGPDDYAAAADPGWPARR
jgi:molybdopterin-guanine dinucleotide biosynthesis protein A